MPLSLRQYKWYSHKSRQSGDTMVEVMIVLAVLGLAIGISYSTANRALLQAREAQENTIATELLQSQIEKLRYLAPNTDSSDTSKYVFQHNTTYCVNEAANIVPTTNSACKPDDLYNISITYCGGSGDPICLGHTSDDTFILQAVWENVEGRGNDTITFHYRLHPS
ncbi:MAG: type II secretion system protein [Patescibacteria group bacterium]